MKTAILSAIAALGLVGSVATASAAPPYPPYPNPYYGSGAYERAMAARTCPPGYFWEMKHYDKWGRMWPTGCVRNGF